MEVKESEAQKGAADEARKLAQHINNVLMTDSGKAFWAALFHSCGYNVSSLRFNRDGSLDENSTKCYEAQRKIYINFRNLADPELRAEAEKLAEAAAAKAEEIVVKKK